MAKDFKTRNYHPMAAADSALAEAKRPQRADSGLAHGGAVASLA
jgi:hypothetical protein